MKLGGQEGMRWDGMGRDGKGCEGMRRDGKEKGKRRKGRDGRDEEERNGKIGVGSGVVIFCASIAVMSISIETSSTDGLQAGRLLRCRTIWR